MESTELIRRRAMMGKKEQDIYANMITFDFTVAESYTVNITTNNNAGTASIDKIIIDGIDIGNITTSMSYTFDVGRHKIGWLMVDTANIAQDAIAQIAPINSLPTDKITTIPACVETIGMYAMRGTPAYVNSYFVVHPTIPPTCGAAAIGLWYANTNRPIYVPDDSIELYKSAPQWSDYSSAYKPLSQLTQ